MMIGILNNTFFIMVIIIQVIWKRLYKTKSGIERGTMHQLRNLINRRNVVKKVKSDMNACEDFFDLIVTGHVIACAMQLLGMSSVDAVPSSNVIQSPEEAWMRDDIERKSILMDVSSLIVDQNVDLSTTFADSPSEESARMPVDSVYAYSSETLSLGLLFLEFKDGIREGDGDRVMRVLSQYHLTLPPRLAEQLKWSRFINTHGSAGHNISCDLHMEHLNKIAKVAVDGLGANKSEKAITRVGKAIGTMAGTLDNFDSVNNVPAVSGAHSRKSADKDLHKVVNQLVKSEVFNIKPGRKHKSFRNIKTNSIRSLSGKQLKEWMVERYANVLFESK